MLNMSYSIVNRVILALAAQSMKTSHAKGNIVSTCLILWVLVGADLSVYYTLTTHLSRAAENNVTTAIFFPIVMR